MLIDWPWCDSSECAAVNLYTVRGCAHRADDAGFARLEAKVDAGFAKL